MSCRVNASVPDSTEVPACFVALAASSNSREPDASVRLNAVSSATAMRWIRSKSLTSSGYDGPIASRTVAIDVADDRLFDPQQLCRPDHAAQQAAQHVAAAVVAGADAVGDDDRRGAAVVGDDPVPDVVFVVALAVPARRDARDEVDDRAQQIRLVDVVDALQQARDALDAHAGVDVLARQRPEDLEVLL